MSQIGFFFLFSMVLGFCGTARFQKLPRRIEVLTTCNSLWTLCSHLRFKNIYRACSIRHEDYVKIDILLSVEENPTSNACQITRHTIVLRCLPKEKPQKLNIVQDLPEKQLEHISANESKLKQKWYALGAIRFCGKSIFTKSCRYRSAENPHH